MNTKFLRNQVPALRSWSDARNMRVSTSTKAASESACAAFSETLLLQRGKIGPVVFASSQMNAHLTWQRVHGQFVWWRETMPAHENCDVPSGTKILTKDVTVL